MAQSVWILYVRHNFLCHLGIVAAEINRALRCDPIRHLHIFILYSIILRPVTKYFEGKRPVTIEMKGRSERSWRVRAVQSRRIWFLTHQKLVKYLKIRSRWDATSAFLSRGEIGNLSIGYVPRRFFPATSWTGSVSKSVSWF